MCPSVVLWNWAREFGVWSPDRVVQILSKVTDRIDPRADVVVTTHGLILTSFIKAQLLGLAWDLTVIDEAHFFRTRSTQRTKTLYGEPARADAPTIVSRSRRVLSMTGTPMPNDASELWAHFYGLRPDLITLPDKKLPMTWTKFRSVFCVLRPGLYGVKVVGVKNSKHLRGLVQQLSLRRVTRNVLKDMPPIRFESMSLRPMKLSNELARLADRMRPRVVKALEAAGDGVTLSHLRSETEFAEFRRLCGIAKATPIAELLTMEMKAHDEKVIIFAHHTDVIREIADGLAAFGVVWITGSTTAKNREKAVALFQFDPSVRVIVCNIIAGGVGVTLTESCRVEMAEMSFVPGDNSQAVKRSHRLGQDRRVRVRCHSLAGTPDELIVDALRLKMSMIREVIS